MRWCRCGCNQQAELSWINKSELFIAVERAEHSSPRNTTRRRAEELCPTGEETCVQNPDVPPFPSSSRSVAVRCLETSCLPRSLAPTPLFDLSDVLAQVGARSAFRGLVRENVLFRFKKMNGRGVKGGVQTSAVGCGDWEFLARGRRSRDTRCPVASPRVGATSSLVQNARTHCEGCSTVSFLHPLLLTEGRLYQHLHAGPGFFRGEQEILGHSPGSLGCRYVIKPTAGE